MATFPSLEVRAQASKPSVHLFSSEILFCFSPSRLSGLGAYPNFPMFSAAFLLQKAQKNMAQANRPDPFGRGPTRPLPARQQPAVKRLSQAYPARFAFFVGPNEGVARRAVPCRTLDNHRLLKMTVGRGKTG